MYNVMYCLFSMLAWVRRIAKLPFYFVLIHIMLYIRVVYSWSTSTRMYFYYNLPTLLYPTVFVHSSTPMSYYNLPALLYPTVFVHSFNKFKSPLSTPLFCLLCLPLSTPLFCLLCLPLSTPLFCLLCLPLSTPLYAVSYAYQTLLDC